MICTYLIHFININSYLLYSVIIVYFFALANLYRTYLLCILRGKKYLKKTVCCEKIVCNQCDLRGRQKQIGYHSAIR